MNNKQIIWARTLLNAHRYLGTLCNSIDKLVDITAKTSFYTGGIWSEENSIYNISQKIIKLSDRKVNYINLKVITEKVLEKMPKKLAKILILKFINRVDIPTIINLLNMSERTYYRRTNDAIKEFAKVLCEFGYNSEKLEIKYLDDKFIASVFEKQSREARITSEQEALSSDDAFEGCMKFFKTGFIS